MVGSSACSLASLVHVVEGEELITNPPNKEKQGDTIV